MQNEEQTKEIIRFKRGQIYVADLTGNSKGSEHNQEAPVLIVQNDIGNKNSPNLIVVPLSPKTMRKNFPAHVRITCEKYKGLLKDSTILCEQIRTISKERITSGKLEQIDREDMRKVEQAISYCIGMPYEERKQAVVAEQTAQSNTDKETQTEPKTLDELMFLLRESYLKDDKVKQNKILAYMIKHKDIYNNKIQSKHLFLLVLLTYIHNWDHKVLLELPTIEKLLKESSNMTLYRLYRMLCKERTVLENCSIVEVASRFIDYNPHSIREVDVVLKDKLLDEVKERSFLYFNNVHCIESTIVCPIHRTGLINKKAAVALSNGQGFGIVRVMHCPKCHKAYLKKEDINYIHDQMRPHKLKITYGELEEIITAQGKSNTKQGQNTNNNFQQSSELSNLGYSVTKSKEERWRILQNQAIPKLGKKKVIAHIEWLIKYNKNNVHRERAIGEWSYDLRRLKS